MSTNKLNKYRIPYYWNKNKTDKEFEKAYYIVDAQNEREAADKAYENIKKGNKVIFVGTPRIIKEEK